MNQNSTPFDLVVGLDRSDRKADLHLIQTASAQKETQTIGTAPEALKDWLYKLRQQYPKARVALCLEQPATNLILFLESYSWITLYPVNPLTLKKFREAFVTSRANDDRKDAHYLAELLWTHHDWLKPWQPDNQQTRQIQALSAHRRAVIDERTALTNQLTSFLKDYFPQALDLCGEELWRPLATSFLLKWPTLQRLQKVRPATLKTFYYLHGSRSQKLIEQRLEQVTKAVALTDDPAVLEAHGLRVQLICRQLQELHQTVAQFDQRLEQVFKAHEDHAIFASLPGAGPVLAPRLMAALGSERDRYPQARNFQCFSGIAPVTKQSGGKCHIHRRYLCPKFIKQTFHEYAGQSLLHSTWAAAYYWQQRQKGSPHQTAVRALAFKWQRIIWKCWQSRTPYSEKIYEAALKKSGSKLISRLEHIDLGKSPMKSLAKKNLKNP